MNTNVRKLTDGAMMAAIVGVVLLIDRQLAGSLSSMLLFLFPLPMVFYSAKYGLKDSWIVLAAIILLVMILGTPQSVFYVGAESLIGMIYGSGVYKGTENRRILLRTLVLGGLVEVLAMLVFASFFGYDLAAELAEYESMVNGIFSETGMSIAATIDLSRYLKTILIVATILTGVMEGLITHIVSRLLLKRMRMKVPVSTPLYAYYPPKWTGYAGMAGIVMYYYSMMRPLENDMAQMFLQGFGFAGVLYLVIFGVIAILVIVPLRWPRFRRGLGLMIVALILWFAWGIAMAGYLYITTDLHQRMVEGVNHDASEH